MSEKIIVGLAEVHQNFSLELFAITGEIKLILINRKSKT
jgi:hypothetical protein